MLTATNPQTGERLAYVAGKWVPLPSADAPDAAPKPQPDASPGFVDAFLGNLGQAAGQQNVQSLGSAVEGAGVLAGNELTGRALRAKVDALADRIPAPAEQPYQPQGIGDALQHPGATLGYALGQGIGSTVPSLVTSGLGGLAGAASPVPGGAEIGALLGAFGPSYVQNFGQNYQDFVDLGTDPETAAKAAAAVALPQGALDTFELGTVFKPFTGIGRRLLGQVAEKKAQSLLARGAKGLAIGAATEGIGEGTQQALEEATASQIAPLYDPSRALGNIGANAFVGAVTGGAFGLPGGVFDAHKVERTVDKAVGKDTPESPPVRPPTELPASSEEDELRAIGAMPDADAIAALRQKYGGNAFKARKALAAIREATPAAEGDSGNLGKVNEPSFSGDASQAAQIATQARSNLGQILGGGWVPLREDETPDAPIVGYVNEQTGERRTVEEHRAGIETPLSGLDPVLPSPDQIAQTVATVKQAAKAEAAPQWAPEDIAPTAVREIVRRGTAEPSDADEYLKEVEQERLQAERDLRQRQARYDAEFPVVGAQPQPAEGPKPLVTAPAEEPANAPAAPEAPEAQPEAAGVAASDQQKVPGGGEAAAAEPINPREGKPGSLAPHEVEAARKFAKPMLDLNRRPTGWLSFDHGGSSILVNPETGETRTFAGGYPYGGAYAQAYAIDNPVEREPIGAGPAPEMVLQPLRPKEPTSKVQENPSPTLSVEEPEPGVVEAPAAEPVLEAGAGGRAEDAAGGVGPKYQPSNSWIVVDRSTHKPVLETYEQKVADAVNRDKYEVVPAGEWLARLNKPGPEREAASEAPASEAPAPVFPKAEADKERAKLKEKLDPTAPFLDGAREFVRTSTKPLTPANLMRHLGIKGEPKLAKDILTKLMLAGDIRQAKDLTYRRKPILKGPQGITAFVASIGGISTKERGEITDPPRMVPGYGPLFRKNGKPLDTVAELAHEAGYIKERDPDEVVRMIEEEMRGARKHVPAADLGDQMQREEEQKAAAERDQLDHYRQGITDQAVEDGLTLTDAETQAAAEYMLRHGGDPSAAIEWAVVHTAADAVDQNPQLGETFDDEHDLPFEWNAPAVAAPNEGAQAGGQARADERAPEGDARAAQGVRPDRSQPAAPRSEVGAEGLPQLILPGAERSAQQAMDARKGKGLKAKANQKAADEGIFAPPKDERQSDIEGKLQALSNRRPWSENFPDIRVLSDAKTRDAHPDYAAAKSGDRKAADRLAEALMPSSVVRSFGRAVKAADATLLPVHALEIGGINEIPMAMAARIAQISDVPVERSVVQTNVVAHTRADGFSRLAAPVGFAGTIEPGRAYYLLDDHMGMGGTLADLRAFIESHGGRVVGATVLSSSRGNAILAAKPETLRALRAKHGEPLEAYWRSEFGHGIDSLTDPEAAYLTRAASVDAIRDRIAAARSARGIGREVGPPGGQVALSATSAPTLAPADTTRLAANVIAGNLSDPEMARIRDAMAADLAPLLKRIAGERANLKVFDQIRGRTKAGEPLAVSGVQVRDLIAVSLLDGQRVRSQGEVTGTVRHEALHLLRESGAIPAPAWAALEAKAASWRAAFGIDQEPAYKALSEAQRNEEAIAEGYSRWARGTLKLAGSPLAGMRWIKRALDGIRGIVSKALGLSKLPRPEEVFQAIESGSYARPLSGFGPDGSDALSVEGLPDDGHRDAQLLGHLVESPSFGGKLLGALDVPTRRAVLSRVFGVAQNPKVLDSIVKLVPVDMMNNLFGGERSAKEILHNESMFLDRFAPDREVSIAASPDETAAFVRIAARAATENLPLAAVTPSDPLEAIPASRANRDLAGGDRPVTGMRAEEGGGPLRVGSLSGERPAAGGALEDGHAAIISELAERASRKAKFQSTGLSPGALLRSPDRAEELDEIHVGTVGALSKLFDPNMRGRAGYVFDQARRLFQDRMIFVRRTEEEAERMLGRPLNESERPYLAEEGYYGRIGEKKFRTDKDFREPLVNLMHDAGLTLNEVDDYLTARHAPERNAAIAEINPKFPDGGSGMTDAEAQAIIDGFNPEKRASLDRIGGLVDQMMERRLATLVDTGVMSVQEADTYRAKYKHYVPLRGMAADLEEEALRPVTGKGFKGSRAREKRALGRGSRAPDVLATAFTLADEAIIRGEKNLVGQALLNLAQAAPNPKVWEVAPVEREAYLAKLADGRQQVRYRYRPTLTGNDIVHVRVDGREVRIRIKDPDLLRAMTSMGGGDLNVMLQALGKVTGALSKLNTMWSPEFLVNNAFMDFQTGLVNLGREDQAALRREVAGNWLNAFKGASSYLKDGKGDTEWKRWAQEFRENGGQTAFNQIGDVETQAKNIEKAVAELQGRNASRARHAIHVIGDTIERYNTGVDNAVRLSTYAALRGRGYTPARAASVAKNLTINFNRKGELGPALNALFMFFNAGMQGTQVLGSAIVRSPTVRKWVAGIVVLGALQEIMGGMFEPPPDDKDGLGLSMYDRIPEWEKENNLIIPYGTEPGEYAKIRMPYGYNFFHNLGRLSAAYLRGAKDLTGERVGLAETIGRMGKAFAQAMIPPGLGDLGVPTLAQPFVDIATNQDYFGKPIAPESHDDTIPKSQLYYPGTSKLAVGTADFLNRVTGGDQFRSGLVDVSPDALVHVLQSYSGSAGALAMSTMTSASNAWGELNGTNPLDPNLSVADVPFVRKMVGKTSPWQTVDITYQRLAEVQRAADQRKAGAQDVNRPLAALESDANKLRRELSTIRKQKLALKDNDAIPVAERRRRSDALDERQSALMANFNRRYLRALQ